MNPMEEQIAFGELQFKRTLERLMSLPGEVRIGRTSDTGDKYAAWYPFSDGRVYVRFLLYGDSHATAPELRGKLEMDSNLLYADELSSLPKPEGE